MMPEPPSSKSRPDTHPPRPTGPRDALRLATLQRDELSQILESLPIASFVLDAAGRVTHWNRACSQLTGRERGEVVGQPLKSSTFYPGPARPLLAELVLRGDYEAMWLHYGDKSLCPCADASDAYEAIDTFRLAGQNKVIHFMAAVLRDGAGRPVGAVETLQDITQSTSDRQRLAEYRMQLQSLASQLATSEERQRRRIASQLHDGVGQYLAGLKLKLQLLREPVSQAGCSDVFDQCIELIHQASQAARSLTFDLCPPMLYELGLNEALDWLAQRLANEHRLRMHFLGDPAVGDLPDDLRGLLFQAGRELLLNVIKHADADHVTLTTRAAGDEIELAVTDDGRGLTDHAPSARETGGGFGLFSLRERLSVIGGQLILRSRTGQGTRVVLRVPRQAPPGQGQVA